MFSDAHEPRLAFVLVHMPNMFATVEMPPQVEEDYWRVLQKAVTLAKGAKAAAKLAQKKADEAKPEQQQQQHQQTDRVQREDDSSVSHLVKNALG